MARAAKRATEERASVFRHPRETFTLTGQHDAEQFILQACHSGRMPHAWLIAGARGTGKATLAHRFARFLLAGGTGSGLDVDADSPAVRRAVNGSHTDLMVLENAPGSDIPVEEARKVAEFFSLTPAEGCWRVVIIDSVDAMNRNAANAILKTLEEPPKGAVLLLVSHNPGILLPTIRSRCRLLKTRPLDETAFAAIVQEHMPDMDAAHRRVYYHLSGGSPGVALFLAEQEALALYITLLELFPVGKIVPDWLRVHLLADQLSSQKETPRFEALQHVLQYLFQRLIHQAGYTGEPDGVELLEGENAVLRHIAAFHNVPRWLDIWQESASLLQDTKRIHLERKQVLLNIISSMRGV